MARWIILALLLNLTSVLSQLKWQRLHDGVVKPSPSPRRDVAIGYDGERHQLVLFGGRPGPLGDTWIYNITDGRWREVKTDIHPQARFAAVSGLSGDFFYVTTGQGQEKQFYSDIWRLDLVKEEWKEMPAQQKPYYISFNQWVELARQSFRPAERYSAGGGMFPGGKKLFVSQGFSDVRNFDTLSYDVDSEGWHTEYCTDCNPYDPRYPHARYHHAATPISDDELVIYGGCLNGGGTGGPCPSGDSWLFDSRRNTWKMLEDCATPRIHARLASLPSVSGRRRVVLYGGMEDTDQVLHVSHSDPDTIGVLDPDKGTWTLRKTSPMDQTFSTPGMRVSPGMICGLDGILVFGGVDIKRNLLHNDLWILRGDASVADNTPEVRCANHFINMIMIHGILMVFGFAVFLQWGAFIARYSRSKGTSWLYIHIFFQIFGLCCAITGVVFGILSVQNDHFQFLHAILGLLAIILALLQPVNSLMRPPKMSDHGDHKSRRRRLWECIHHFGGHCSILLAFVNISLGVFLAVTSVILWGLWFAYLGLVLFFYAVAELCRSLKGRKRVEPIAEGIDFYPAERTRYCLNEAPKEPPADYITAENIGL